MTASTAPDLMTREQRAKLYEARRRWLSEAAVAQEQAAAAWARAAELPADEPWSVRGVAERYDALARSRRRRATVVQDMLDRDDIAARRL